MPASSIANTGSGNPSYTTVNPPYMPDTSLKGPVFQGQTVAPVAFLGPPVATPPHLEYNPPVLTPPRSATPPYLTPPIGAIHPPDLATPTWTAWMHVGEAIQQEVPTFAHRTSVPTPGLPALQTTDVSTFMEQLRSAVGATANQATPTTPASWGDRFNQAVTRYASRFAGGAPRRIPTSIPTGYLARLPIPITSPLEVQVPFVPQYGGLPQIHPPVSAR